MKKIIEFFQALFGRKKKPPVIVSPKPKPEQKPDSKPIEQPIPEEKPAEHVFNWPDRRPIGMVMLANYNSWTDTDNYMNGEIPLSEWLVIHAQNCIKYMREINAQGLVVWDPEGQKWPRYYTYYGDPKLTRLEIDIFFKIIREAGFRTGVCLRPDEIRWEPSEYWATTPLHYTVASPFNDLKEKLIYAKKRWGCSLFYTDSNVGEGIVKPINEETGEFIEVENSSGAGGVMPASIFKDLSVMFPDVLLMPEHQNNEYYLYTAPYNDKHFGHLLTPEEKGFMALNVSFDENPTWTVEQLKETVKQGNILIGRVWYNSPELPLIKAAYEQT